MDASEVLQTYLQIIKIYVIIHLFTRTFQNVYFNVFPEIYCSNERRVLDLKINFRIMFNTYKDKKQLEISLRKNLESYETIRNVTSVFEQKVIKVDDFNEIEEKRGQRTD